RKTSVAAGARLLAAAPLPACRSTPLALWQPPAPRLGGEGLLCHPFPPCQGHALGRVAGWQSGSGDRLPRRSVGSSLLAPLRIPHLQRAVRAAAEEALAVAGCLAPVHRSQAVIRLFYRLQFRPRVREFPARLPWREPLWLQASVVRERA